VVASSVGGARMWEGEKELNRSESLSAKITLSLMFLEQTESETRIIIVLNA
jgi:hypothetical protein